jgi:hypothetical protein
LATAVALLGRKTNAVWRKLSFFFDRNDGVREEKETESVASDGTRVTSDDPIFPVDHLRLGLKHEADVLERSDGTAVPAKPRATGTEKAGGHSLILGMWPFATIAYAIGRPLDAAIADFTEEQGMPSNEEIRERLAEAIAQRSHAHE